LRLQSALIHSLLLAGLATSTQARAQSDASIEEASQTFQLGTVDVRDNRDAVSGDEQRLGASEMRLRNADTVADAVRQLPGATLSRNSRNEEMIYLRGFDSRQVPVYVDGVPLYVPYDGYVDFSRFTTFDLSEIRVAKAGASLMYGPNTLGGAINLVTRKPVKPFEGDARIGAGAGGERKAAVNLGVKLGNWFYQLGASYLDADSFQLPKGFKDF
jgi:iron complex outermembrane receptor protein